MTIETWQLIPVEDADLQPIDLKLGATLLGRGQRASPGLQDDSVARTAARLQVSAGHVQITSMAHPGVLRVTGSDSSETRKLARGHAALLALGDLIDFANVTDVSVPSSRFTYMLAEYFPEDDVQVRDEHNPVVPSCNSQCTAKWRAHKLSTCSFKCSASSNRSAHLHFASDDTDTLKCSTLLAGRGRSQGGQGKQLQRFNCAVKCCSCGRATCNCTTVCGSATWCGCSKS